VPSRLPLHRSLYKVTIVAEAALGAIATYAAVGVEAAAVVLIGYGAADAFVKVAGHILRGRSPAGWRKEVFVRFGVWLLLGLQFALAADVLHSIVAPTWNQIGQLGAMRRSGRF
jgi:uncharacterized membrane protein